MSLSYLKRSKSYSDKKPLFPAVFDVDFKKGTLRSCKKCPSGSGKSTLRSCKNTRRKSKTIPFYQEDISKTSLRIGKNVPFDPEDFIKKYYPASEKALSIMQVDLGGEKYRGLSLRTCNQIIYNIIMGERP